ncbi:MAG: RNA methyltransferase [Anaerolineae bacterium]
MIITSSQNPKLKRLVSLRERRTRAESGLALVEGFEEVELALSGRARITECYYSRELFRLPQEATLLTRLADEGAALYEVDARLFPKIAYREHPDGWLAVAQLPHLSLGHLRLSDTPFVLIAESVEKPGNLGAMLRTAEAAGVEAVIAADPRTDWANPNVIRASKGALFCLQTCESPTAPLIDWLKAQSIQIVIATPEAAVPYHAPNYRGGVAIVMGTEKEGVSRRWHTAADHAVAIPMFGKVNSLNVSVAAAILLYEVVRQRAK